MNHNISRNVKHTEQPYELISRSLNTVKGWAIVWIVAYHLMGNTQGYLDFSETAAALTAGGIKNIGIKNTVAAALEIFISAGSAGVNVFLVISGFGLTASWWRRYGAKDTGSKTASSMPLVAFWQKRIFRIFPLFWAAIVLALVAYYIDPNFAPFGQELWQADPWSVMTALLATFTTLRNFIPDYYYFLNGAWWYIGLSLQLYFIFPLLIRLGQAWGWPKLLLRALLFSLAYRTVCSFLLIGQIEDFSTTVAFAFFPARLFEFVFGMYIAMAVIQPAGKSTSCSVNKTKPSHLTLYKGTEQLLFNPKYQIFNLCCFATGLAFSWIDHPVLHIFQEVFLTVGLFCGLICLSQINLSNFNFRFLHFLARAASQIVEKGVGKYSYGIYLTHMNVYLVLWAIATPLIPFYWPRFVVVTFTCCAIGIGFEAGFNQIQRRLKQTRATPNT
ncbi:MAG: acyltransferase family protein [Phormidesmis sp.]